MKIKRNYVLFALVFAFTVTSCRDDDDPKIKMADLYGIFKTESVLYDGETFTSACESNWPVTVENLRKVDLELDLYNVQITRYGCGFSNTYYIIQSTPIDDLLNADILDFHGSYVFKILSLSNGTLKLELLSTDESAAPVGAVYTLKKQS